MWGERERAMVVLCCAFVYNVASADTVLKAGTIGEDVQLTWLPEAGGAREAVANDPILAGGIDCSGVVRTPGGTQPVKRLEVSG